VYGNLGVEEARLQQLRVDAFRALSDDVHSGAYPEDKHTLEIDENEFASFLNDLESVDS